MRRSTATGRVGGPGRRTRRWVVAATLVVGAVLLSVTLRMSPGDDRFLPAAFALAAVWGGGALLAGGAWLGGTRLGSGGLGGTGLGGGTRPTDATLRPGAQTRSLILGLGTGTALLATFLLGALLVARIPVLREPAETLLDHADRGALLPVLVLTVVNGIAEEWFFRGALYDALPARAALPVTTLVYTLTTVGSGVALLVLAAAVLAIVTGVLRDRTDGVVAPIAAHLTWSVGMLLFLPTMLATGR